MSKRALSACKSNQVEVLRASSNLFFYCFKHFLPSAKCTASCCAILGEAHEHSDTLARMISDEPWHYGQLEQEYYYDLPYLHAVWARDTFYKAASVQIQQTFQTRFMMGRSTRANHKSMWIAYTAHRQQDH